MSAKTIFSFLFFGLLITFCKVDPKVKAPLGDLKEKAPADWPPPVYTLSNNALSEDRFFLGRALFYENMLSKDNSISCGSCHQQFSAFANGDHRVSHGINGLLGNRNSPAMFNLAWHPSFMHDGGINHIEVQPLGPISNPIEMDEDINMVLQKLQASAKYKSLFKKAYGSEVITSQAMLKAMAQFMTMMYSMESKFDDFKRGRATLSNSEQKGYELFLANCNACHREPLFSDFKLRSNGLKPDPFVKDSGRAALTGRAEDLYKFKTPSLRNITVTAPYMHDGRYESLEECLDHYTNHIDPKSNPDALVQNGLKLTEQDKSELISFLKTLTDFNFLKDERFKDPNFE